MTEIQIAWLELMTVGGLGVILVLLGVTFNIIVKRQNQLCTKQTDGIVKQYGFPGNGRVYPIVEYFVNGTCYKTNGGVLETTITNIDIHTKERKSNGCGYKTEHVGLGLRGVSKEQLEKGDRVIVKNANMYGM